MADPTLEAAFGDSTGWKKLADVIAGEVSTIRRWMKKNSHERCVWTHPNGFRVVVVRHNGELFARAIHQPIDISGAPNIGPAAERATLIAASGLGLPDLVFRGMLVSKGNARREIGDGSIISGSRGLAIQVKARQRSNTGNEPEKSDEDWVRRQVRKASSQASGSVRSLRNGPVLKNYRNHEVDISRLGSICWVRMVIIDHPSPPVLELATEEDLVVLTRRDWEFLFRQLLSTSAVVDYVHRIATDASSSLGEESNRYFELALADLHPTLGDVPSWVDEKLVQSRPRLPVEPATEGDMQGLQFFRRMLEEIAQIPNVHDETDRFRVLSQVDQLGGNERAEIGRLLINRLSEMRCHTEGNPDWRALLVIPDFGATQLGFAVTANKDIVQRTNVARNWTTLRHAEFARKAGVDVTTILILLSPAAQEDSWQCVVSTESGPSGLDDREFAELLRVIGRGRL